MAEKESVVSGDAPDASLRTADAKASVGVRAPDGVGTTVPPLADRAAESSAALRSASDPTDTKSQVLAIVEEERRYWERRCEGGDLPPSPNDASDGWAACENIAHAVAKLRAQSSASAPHDHDRCEARIEDYKRALQARTEALSCADKLRDDAESASAQTEPPIDAVLTALAQKMQREGVTTSQRFIGGGVQATVVLTTLEDRRSSNASPGRDDEWFRSEWAKAQSAQRTGSAQNKALDCSECGAVFEAPNACDTCGDAHRARLNKSEAGPLRAAAEAVLFWIQKHGHLDHHGHRGPRPSQCAECKLLDDLNDALATPCASKVEQADTLFKGNAPNLNDEHSAAECSDADKPQQHASKLASRMSAGMSTDKASVLPAIDPVDEAIVDRLVAAKTGPGKPISKASEANACCGAKVGPFERNAMGVVTSHPRSSDASRDDEDRPKRPGWTHGKDRDGGMRTIYRDGENVGQMLSGDAIAMVDALRSGEAYLGQCPIHMLDERCLLPSGHGTRHDFPSERRAAPSADDDIVEVCNNPSCNDRVGRDHGHASDVLQRRESASSTATPSPRTPCSESSSGSSSASGGPQSPSASMGTVDVSATRDAGTVAVATTAGTTADVSTTSTSTNSSNVPSRASAPNASLARCPTCGVPGPHAEGSTCSALSSSLDHFRATRDAAWERWGTDGQDDVGFVMKAVMEAEELVRRETIEACAKVCEEPAAHGLYETERPEWVAGWERSASTCARRIRSLLKGGVT